MRFRHYRSICAVRTAAFLCLLLLASSRHTLAQTQPADPWESGRVRIGPVAFTPGLALKNLGWESNVFGEPENPKGDFTVTAGGFVNWWMRGGKLRFVGSDYVDYVYYATYASERGWNHGHTLRIEYRLNRLLPYVLGSYASLYDRSNYEITTRERHSTSALGAGLVLRVTSKTQLDIAGLQTSDAYPSDAEYNGQSLAQALNHTDRIGRATLRYSATPLTTLTLLSEFREERFDGSPERDNDSFRIVPGVQLDPFAVIKGSASVGYLHFNALSPATPDFSGVVADVGLSYVLLGRTQFSAGVKRDIQFSYNIEESYYLLTSVSGSVRESLGKGWDLEARVTSQRLAYQQVSVGNTSADGRVDRLQSYGGGLGHRLSQGTRIGANVDYIRQWSDYLPGYSSLRYGMSATYEF